MTFDDALAAASKQAAPGALALKGAVSTDVIRRPFYAKAEHEPVEGQVRSMSWREPVIALPFDLWKQRVADYWALQGVLYGFRVDPIMLWRETVGGAPVICTVATVVDVLPGRRHRKDVWSKHVHRRYRAGMVDPEGLKLSHVS